ncbi:MAG: NAD-dependent epimerase/dehydratase family protein [Chloroflexi bacterium]|nr:MAG: NAD-dependent epimerase/dehydratase family protein [Chloroflexota bacterium]
MSLVSDPRSASPRVWSQASTGTARASRAPLLGRGDTVRVLALAGEQTGWLEERAVAVHRGDIREPDTLIAPMRGAQVVVNLAAMMDVWRPIADYRAVNVTGTENVCRASLAAGVQRLVHMSSSSIYGMGAPREVDESFPLRPFADPYPVTKAEGDALVRRMITEDRLPAVIIRPDQIFGPGDHLHFGHMADRLRSARSIIVGRGHNRMPFVYVSDAVQGLMLAIDHPRAIGNAYNITNDKRLTQQQLLEAIADGIGVKPPRLHVPYRLLYAAGYAAERAACRDGGADPDIPLPVPRRRPPNTFAQRYAGHETQLTPGLPDRVPVVGPEKRDTEPGDRRSPR